MHAGKKKKKEEEEEEEEGGGGGEEELINIMGKPSWAYRVRVGQCFSHT